MRTCDFSIGVPRCTNTTRSTLCFGEHADGSTDRIAAGRAPYDEFDFE
jgi:hypothetical protein